MDRPIAHLSLGVATVNDIIGWLLLGVVVGVAESGTIEFGPLLLAVVVVVAVCVIVVRFGPPLLDRANHQIEKRAGGPAAEISVLTLTVVAVGAITHAAGIEVVIGAFIAGIAIGRSNLRGGRGFAALESVTYGIFAPLFFAVAGIRVDLTDLASRPVAVWAIVVTVAATVSKLVGAYVGGRVGGLDRRDSLGLGASLNARGALEIVVATVGLSLGVIGSTAYTVIVVMALVTTALTGPMLHWIYRREAS